MIEPQDLINQIKTYNASVDEDAVVRAYEYAKTMHEGQFRSSGEPYYKHPVEVASI